MHLRIESIDALLERPSLWNLACRTPWMFTASSLHRAGLWALEARAFETSDVLLEEAALRYRKDLRVEALARVRVHQRMAQAGATRDVDERARLEAEIAHGLHMLDWIESPAAPHAPVDARMLLPFDEDDEASERLAA